MPKKNYYGSKELERALSHVHSYLKKEGDETLGLPKTWDASYVMEGALLNDSEVKLEFSSSPIEGGMALLALRYETCLSICKNETYLIVGSRSEIIKWIEDLSPSETEIICRELHRSNDVGFQPYDFR